MDLLRSGLAPLTLTARLVDDVEAAAAIGRDSDLTEAVLRWRSGLFTGGHTNSDVGHIRTWAHWSGFCGGA